MNKKRVVICCTIGIGLLIFGGVNFELYGIDSNIKALAVALSLTLGLVLPIYGFTGMGLDNKTTANNGEKPMAKKEKKEPKTIASVTNTSVDLMRREIELFDRKKELEKLVSEVKSELAEVQEKISSKGWTAKEDGSWVIE